MKVIFKGIGKIFRWIWKLISFTRQLIINLLFLIIIGALFFAFTESGKEPELPEQAALVLDLSGPIVEQRSYTSRLIALPAVHSVMSRPKKTSCSISSIPCAPLPLMNVLLA